MARPKSTDPLQNFRFALTEVSVNPNERPTFFPESGSLVSFQSISIPEVTIESLSFIEGTEMFSHHVNVGRAETGSVTVTKAVIPGKSVDFYSWIHRAIFGLGSPRKNFDVHHFPHGEVARDAVGAVIYRLEGCIPETFRPSTDLAGDEDGISVEELTFHCHRVILRLPDRPRAPGSSFDPALTI